MKLGKLIQGKQCNSTSVNGLCRLIMGILLISTMVTATTVIYSLSERSYIMTKKHSDFMFHFLFLCINIVTSKQTKVPLSLCHDNNKPSKIKRMLSSDKLLICKIPVVYNS